MYYLPLSYGYLWLERVLCSIAFLHNLSAFIVTLWRNRINKELSQEHNLGKSLFRITTITILLYAIFTLLSLITVFVQYYPDLIPCDYWYTMVFIAYYMSKFSIWYYQIVRCKVVFRNSLYLQYKSFTLNLISFIFALTAIGLTSFLVSTSHIYDLIFMSEGDHCCLYKPFVCITVTIGAFDAIMGIAGYWLFYKKMSILTVIIHERKTKKRSNPTKNSDVSIDIEQHTKTRSRFTSEAERRSNYEMLYVLRKYAILSACTLISTWIAAGFATFITSHIGFFAVDTMVNTWCILLYDARYDAIYNKIFGCISKSEWRQSDDDTVIGENKHKKMKMKMKLKARKLEQVHSASTKNPGHADRAHHDAVPTSSTDFENTDTTTTAEN